MGGDKVKVRPRQLEGEERERAWQLITGEQKRYSGYETKTDREIPVIRLEPQSA